jgi:hypothetical protein
MGTKRSSSIDQQDPMEEDGENIEIKLRNRLRLKKDIRK